MAINEDLLENGVEGAADRRDYQEVTIQIRLPSGDVIRNRFRTTDKLRDVHSWVKREHPELVPFTLLQPFPHKVMKRKDMKITLAAHGLVPSGTLMVHLQTGSVEKFNCIRTLMRCFGRN